MCKVRVSEDPVQTQAGFFYDEEARWVPTLSEWTREA